MIDIGSFVFLELKEKKNEDEMNNRFRCKLANRSDAVFEIDYPINLHTNKPSYFLDGTEFHASFIGRDGAMYTFDTEIIGRKKNNIPLLILKDPGKKEYIRIQRRDYVRVETMVDVALHPENEEFIPFTTVSVDLSGGGCAVKVPQGVTFPDEGKLKLWLVLPIQSGELSYATTTCKIVRVGDDYLDNKRRASLQFIDMDEYEQQKVIRYCFEKQRQLHRNR
ncbi:pilus assembly protein PilZ [bacterium LRH843]|nr:pilus assembly protein PilZ [bacterium LRH843]